MSYRISFKVLDDASYAVGAASRQVPKVCIFSAAMSLSLCSAPRADSSKVRATAGSLALISGSSSACPKRAVSRHTQVPRCSRAHVSPVFVISKIDNWNPTCAAFQEIDVVTRRKINVGIHIGSSLRPNIDFLVPIYLDHPSNVENGNFPIPIRMPRSVVGNLGRRCCRETHSGRAFGRLRQSELAALGDKADISYGTETT